MLSSFFTFAGATKYRTKAPNGCTKGILGDWRRFRRLRMMTQSKESADVSEIGQKSESPKHLSEIPDFGKTFGHVPESAQGVKGLKIEGKMADEDTPEIERLKKEYGVVRGYNIDDGSLDLINWEEVITPEFTDKLLRRNICVRISNKFKLYCRICRKVELKFLDLKEFLPKRTYDEAYSKWAREIMNLNRRIAFSAEPYFNEAYGKATYSKDVRLYDERFQVRIIDHMENLWKPGTPYFNMAMAVAGDKGLRDLEEKIDEAITVASTYSTGYDIGL